MCDTSPAAHEMSTKPRIMAVGTPIPPSSAATAPVALIVMGRLAAWLPEGLQAAYTGGAASSPIVK
jgi:hypothetical protein